MFITPTLSTQSIILSDILKKRLPEAVLFVDDEDMLIEVAEELLNQLGYKILIARSENAQTFDTCYICKYQRIKILRQAKQINIGRVNPFPGFTLF